MTLSQSNKYYLPSPSTWPITGAVMMALLGFRNNFV